MRKLLYVVTLMTGLFILGACQEKKPTPQETAAPELYRSVVGVLRGYSDSIARAKDSAGVNRLMERLTEELTGINFNQPANTDWSLSEDENDSIYQLTTRLMKLRDERLKKLSKDSVETDSIAAPEPKDPATSKPIKRG